MKTLRLLMTFYKSFALFSLVITLACSSILNAKGIGTFTALFWFKIITLAITFYVMNDLKADNYYYYKNLGLTRQQFWTSTMIFDFLLFIAILIISMKLR